MYALLCWQGNHTRQKCSGHVAESDGAICEQSWRPCGRKNQRFSRRKETIWRTFVSSTSKVKETLARLIFMLEHVLLFSFLDSGEQEIIVLWSLHAKQRRDKKIQGFQPMSTHLGFITHWMYFHM